MFSLNKNNLTALKAAADHYGKVYFHGCGNIYHKEEESNFRQEFANDLIGPSTYRIIVKKGDAIPETIEEMSKLLMESKSKEVIEAARPREVTGLTTFKIPVAEVKENTIDADAELLAKADAEVKGKADQLALDRAAFEQEKIDFEKSKAGKPKA